MDEKQIIKTIMRTRGWSQEKLSYALGYKGQTNINALLNAKTKGMRMDIVVKMATELGCEVVIRDKYDNKQEWIVGMHEEPEKELTKDEEIAMLREQLRKYQEQENKG